MQYLLLWLELFIGSTRAESELSVKLCFLSPFLTCPLKNMQKLILSRLNRRKRQASNAENFEYFRVHSR